MILIKEKDTLFYKATFFIFLCVILFIYGYYKTHQKRNSLDNYFYSYLFMGHSAAMINPQDSWGLRFSQQVETEMLKNGYDTQEIQYLSSQAANDAQRTLDKIDKELEKNK